MATKPKPSARRAATFEDLKTKPKRTDDLVVAVGGELLSITVESIDTHVYDDLVGAHPPKKDDKSEGAVYNLDTFAPALIAKCTTSPVLTAEQATEIWESPTWARGELFDWFMSCIGVCNDGLRVPTTANGSE